MHIMSYPGSTRRGFPGGKCAKPPDFFIHCDSLSRDEILSKFIKKVSVVSSLFFWPFFFSCCVVHTFLERGTQSHPLNRGSFRRFFSKTRGWTHPLSKPLIDNLFYGDVILTEGIRSSYLVVARARVLARSHEGACTKK